MLPLSGRRYIHNRHNVHSVNFTVIAVACRATHVTHAASQEFRPLTKPPAYGWRITRRFRKAAGLPE
jgi:hypothetical protein